MKKMYTTLALLCIGVMSFSQPYFIYTAKGSGLWYDVNNWNIIPRGDGVTKHKIVIPAAFTITADNNVNAMGLGNVEVLVAGRINLVPGTTLVLSASSSIQLNNGVISGSLATQQILIGGVTKYKGDVDAIKTGHSIADNTTGIAPLGFRAFGMLPVHFTSFLIGKTAGSVQLNWSTDKEVDNSHFEIERSFDGLDWLKIAVVFGAGNSDNTHNYRYNDKISTNAVVYYRLRQVDIDGRSVYSSIKSIREGEPTSVARIYGSEKNVVIDLSTESNSRLVVSVLSCSGHVIARKTVDNPDHKININLSNVSTGAYIVQVTDNKGWTEVQKVIL